MDLDNELFTQELRKRFSVLLALREMSISTVSKAANDKGNAFKFFMSGRTQKMSLTLFLRLARALDMPYQALIESAGYTLDNSTNPLSEAIMVDEKKDDERLLRTRAAKNLKFLRVSVDKSLEEFATEARLFKDGEPDASMIEAFEAGQKLIPPMTAMRLSEAFGFSVEDIYA